jgi:hypothetical protein
VVIGAVCAEHARCAVWCAAHAVRHVTRSTLHAACRVRIARCTLCGVRNTNRGADVGKGKPSLEQLGGGRRFVCVGYASPSGAVARGAIAVQMRQHRALSRCR